MNLAATQYSLKYNAFEIYLSGCNGVCEGCCNPELKEFGIGKTINAEVTQSLLSKITDFDLIIKNIWVLGGDPMDNNQSELTQLLNDLSKTNKQIWLWTRYDLKDIPNNIKQYCDYIKSGEYIPRLSIDNNIQYGIKLQTSNQNIFIKGTDY